MFVLDPFANSPWVSAAKSECKSHQVWMCVCMHVCKRQGIINDQYTRYMLISIVLLHAITHPKSKRHCTRFVFL